MNPSDLTAVEFAGTVAEVFEAIAANRARIWRQGDSLWISYTHTDGSNRILQYTTLQPQ